MGDWKKWVAVLGGLVALVGQFWGANYYLPAVGGAVAAIAALLID